MKLTDFNEIKADKVCYTVKSKKPLLILSKQVILHPNNVYFILNAKGVIQDWFKVNVQRVLDIPMGYKIVAIDMKNKSLIAKMLKTNRVVFERR